MQTAPLPVRSQPSASSVGSTDEALVGAYRMPGRRTRLGLTLALPLWLLSACGGSEESPAPTGTPVPTQVPAVTYYRDVKPILDRVCANCHVEGGVAPSTFEGYEQASARSATIASYVSSGYMPPKAADPSCNDYVYSERMTITDDERQILQSWHELGAPAGDPATQTAVEPGPGHLAQVDMSLRLPSVHYPTFDESGNQYACYVVDDVRSETLFVSGLEAFIDKAEIVHHVVLYKGTGGATDDLTDPTQGWDCMDGNGGEWEMVAAWAPGNGPLVFPEGAALRVDPEDKLVVQMHYFKSREGAETVGDKSGYDLTLVDSAETELLMAGMGTDDFMIPAGDTNYSASAEVVNELTGLSLELYGVFPHMHVLGKRYDYELEAQNGAKTCLAGGQRDFHNQANYLWKQTAMFDPGETIRFTCTWDNSAGNPGQLNNPPVDVSYGERTQEEMCFGFTWVAVVRTGSEGGRETLSGNEAESVLSSAGMRRTGFLGAHSGMPLEMP